MYVLWFVLLDNETAYLWICLINNHYVKYILWPESYKEVHKIIIDERLIKADMCSQI
jgi:hypothetical protein